MNASSESPLTEPPSDPLPVNASVPPEKMHELPYTPFWKTLWAFARPYRGPLALAAFCAMVVGAIIPVQMQFMVKWIIDSALETSKVTDQPALFNDGLRETLMFVALFIALSALRVCIWIVGFRHMLKSIEGILFRIRSHFFRHVQRMCFRFHDQVSSGELFNYIMGSPVNSLKMFLNQFCMNVPHQIISWLLSVTLLATFNWRMTIITVIVVVVVVRLNYRSRIRMRDVSADFMKTESNASRYIADMFRGSRAVKTYTMEDSVNHLFNHQIMQIRDQGYRMATRQQIEYIKPECIQYAGMALIFASGAFFMITEQMSAGTFTAFILGFNLLMQPILALLQLNIIRANAESGLDRIMRVMQVAESTPEPPPEKKVDADKQARDTRHNTEAGIVFDDVHFSYDGETPVYRGVSCQVEDGESVALVGPSGSGKTTFVSLLMRFYDSQQGRIIVNGVDIREYGIRELRSMFGVVPQDPFVFQATLRDNICVTAPEASEDAIQHAMDIACMTEFVDELPHGIHTWLGEGGSNLSGGQRQRLAIARAILANPRYYIFDEATSALDNTSERRIQSSMEQIMKDHTTIIIAHRLSTIRNVDRILVFDHGRVIQSGSYAELAAQPGLFAELLQAAEDTGHFD
jgi:ABC-type multidrug transport system fused ATPase/permease subunit